MDNPQVYETNPLKHQMTLRDYFAGQVLMGVWMNNDVNINDKIGDKTTARFSYFMADAMLKERAKNG